MMWLIEPEGRRMKKPHQAVAGVQQIAVGGPSVTELRKHGVRHNVNGRR